MVLRFAVLEPGTGVLAPTLPPDSTPIPELGENPDVQTHSNSSCPLQDKCVYCPMSGKPLKMKDLTPVCFTPADPSVDRVGLINRQDRYICAVTHDMLGNSVPCAVLRPS